MRRAGAAGADTPGAAGRAGEAPGPAEESRVITRLAPIGVAVILLSLAAFAGWAVLTSRATAGRVAFTSTENDFFAEAHYAVGQEESFEREYRLAPGPEALASHHAASDALAVALGRLRDEGDGEDRDRAASLLADHARYLDVAGRMFAAVDAGDTARVDQIDTGEGDPIFNSIQQRIDTAAAAHRAEAVGAVNDLSAINRVILWSTLILTGLGLAMIMVFWIMLRAYQRRRAESARFERNVLRRNEARFRALVQNSSDMITVIAPDTTVLYQSPASARVLGYDPAELEGVRASSFLHPDDLERIGIFVAEAIKRDAAPMTVEARLRHGDGSWRQVEILVSNRLADEHVGGFVLNIRDVTERRALEEQLRHQAFYDPLTGLANRARFTDRLEHELNRSARHGRPVAVLFMDLDDFKSVNDARGHPAGDRLLIDVAVRLEMSLRPGDTAARFGGDEFAILLDEISGPDEALDVGGRIIEALRAPFTLDGNDVYIRASIGVALSGRSAAQPEELLRRADVAMYVAKGQGKGRCELYDPGMQASIVERMTLASDLQRAVDRGEFVVYYQPVVELDTGRITGAEALVRWQHPERGLLQPAEFISLAEETGLILPLGQWVLEEACQRARSWQEAYPAEPPLTMAVNVSVGQIYQPGLKEIVVQTLRDTGLAPRSLILEITESVMMWDADTAIERLDELKALGVRLAVDDFGTGYSSLSYLRRFPVDVLKIDKSFVDGMGRREKEEDLARVIVELGRTLKLEIVAEGIERAEQLVRLRTLHCKYGQGYYFAQPLDGEAIDALLRKGRTIHPPSAAAA